jgi:hypothetical protein
MSEISKIVIQFNLHLRVKRLLEISAIASNPILVFSNIPLMTDFMPTEFCPQATEAG